MNLAPKISPKAHITKTDAGEHSLLADAVERAFEKALQRKSKLPQEILNLPGMSGQLYRHFINNLIEDLPDARYLETGSFTGSTMCSAIFGNDLRAYAIDNWSEFGDRCSLFLQNISVATNRDVKFNLQTSDFRKVNYSHLNGKFNVYLFDGPHEEQDQYDGVTIADPAVDDEFVLIVDDYNWDRVREGTLRGIKDMKYETLLSYEVRTSLDNGHPEVCMHESEWHNGYYIAVLRKTSAGV